jgi:uncharacterized iron-regulated membrane protein
MQHVLDKLVIAVGIVAALGGVLTCFYSVYHSAMIAVCWWRDTPPDQRSLWKHVRVIPNSAKVHRLKAIIGLLAFLGFFLLIVGANWLLPD